jgi:TatA/E family protein of Tat protein translocase
VFLLILESLGSTELLFILVMALVFFGPRKLPQLSRSLGKGLAEFRKASEDFKTTWAREVNLEEANTPSSPSYETPTDNSILAGQPPEQSLQLPTIEAVAADRVVPREREPVGGVTHEAELEKDSAQTEPSRKQDWL